MLQSNEPNRGAETIRIEGPLPKSLAFVPGTRRTPDGRYTRNRNATQLAFRNGLQRIRDVRCRGQDRHILRGRNPFHDAQIGLTGVVRTL